MTTLVLLAALAAADPSADGPTAARIAELQYATRQRLCADFSHLVQCPSAAGADIVTDVRCVADAGPERLSRCSFVMRRPGQRRPDACSAVFSADETGTWSYPRRPPPPAGEYSSASLAIEGPQCAPVGSPTAAEIAALRASAWAQLSCVLHPSDRPCPPPSATVEVIHCGSDDFERRASCAYRVIAAGQLAFARRASPAGAATGR